MVFRRSVRRYVRRGRGRGRRRGPRYSTFGAAKFLARKAWAGVRYLKGLVNSELYKYDQSATAQSVASDSNYALHLTSIAIGDADGQRTGNSIFVRHVVIDGEALYNVSSSAAGQTVHFALIIDTQQVGDTTPVWTDVFNDVYPWAHIKPTTQGRFTILRRFSLVLPKNGSTMKRFSIRKTMRHHVRYNGSAGTDIQKGGLYLLATSDIANASNPPAFSIQARVSYHDN